MSASFPIVVLVSGNGSNLQALIDYPNKTYNIAAVISNRPNAFALQRASQANLTYHVVDHQSFANRAEFDTALAHCIDQHQPKLVVLAGFMRQLGDAFVEHYANRIINIHPSLLPKYPGLHTHQRALDAGDKQHGVSVHLVTHDLDAGPLIAQAHLAIQANDDADSLKQRVQGIEHQLYPYVVNLFAQGTITCWDGQLLYAGKSLEKGGLAWPGMAQK